MKLSREEMETTILGNAVSNSDWTITTADPRIIRKLQKLGWESKALGAGPYLRFILPFPKIRFARPENRKPTGRPFTKRTKDLAAHANSREISDQIDAPLTKPLPEIGG